MANETDLSALKARALTHLDAIEKATSDATKARVEMKKAQLALHRLSIEAAADVTSLRNAISSLESSEKPW